uniref:Uncharacterized protein n=1 Tax=Onchocerca volvulus TaxID=6282 RepID=A0A8R1TMI6_ONCVO
MLKPHQNIIRYNYGSLPSIDFIYIYICIVREACIHYSLIKNERYSNYCRISDGEILLCTFNRDGKKIGENGRRLEINEEEAERASLPICEESWLTEAEWASLPEDDDYDSEMLGHQWRRVALNWTRTISTRFPYITSAGCCGAEGFQPADIANILGQFRRKLVPPQADANTVVCIDGIPIIVYGICGRQFETIKRWHIHSSRMHKQDGFCSNCDHNLLLPSSFTQKCAAVELHVLEWCPRTRAVAMNERQTKTTKKIGLSAADLILWGEKRTHRTSSFQIIRKVRIFGLSTQTTRRCLSQSQPFSI